jgi:hypothetical protein
MGIAHDDVADDPVAAEQDADLAAEPARGLGQVPGELRRDDLPRIDAAAVGALQGAKVGGLDATEIAVNLVGDDRLLYFNRTGQWTVGGE